jgi:uncharacterized cupredoxin-like copper-binding protein
MPVTDSEGAPDVPSTFSKRRVLGALVGAGAAAVMRTASAHTDKPHAGSAPPARKEQKAWGIAGDAKAARRTVNVRMLDTMRFVPDRLEVRTGDTLRFVVHNTGQAMHEFVIGTRQENEAHAALMLRFPTMEHDEPYMAHVAPGETGEIIWTFNRRGEFEFACLVAGHYSAGMVGTINVVNP